MYCSSNANLPDSLVGKADNVAGDSFWALQVKTAFEFAFVTLALAVGPNRNDLRDPKTDIRGAIYLKKVIYSHFLNILIFWLYF